MVAALRREHRHADSGEPIDLGEEKIDAGQVVIPLIGGANRDPERFSDELGRSFEEYGFAVIADHGIPQALIDRAEEKAKAFFALPEATKRSYAIPGGGGS